MQYSNFNMRNNVHATLSTAVSSVATTIQLTAGQGSRFGTTFPQIATIESFDENGKVIKREIVKITARNGDNLTVVRAFAPCPENDDANSQSQSAISFNADDQISLYIPKEIFDKIHDSLNDIYDNGTNNLRTELVSGLDVEVNAGPVLVGSSYYDFAGGTITLTDNATNYLEIDEDGNLANNTTGRNDESTKLAIITTSGGSVTNIKDRRLGTVGGKIGGVNIHDLTEKQNPDPNDEFIIADSEAIFQNKKVKFGEFQSGLSYNDNYAFAGDNLIVGDVLDKKKIFSVNLVGSQRNIRLDTSTSAIAVKQTSIGHTINKLGLLFYAQSVSSISTPTILTIEGDNNGEPDGNPIYTQDITNDFFTQVFGKSSRTTLVDGQDIIGPYNTTFAIRDIAPDDKHVFIYHNGNGGIYETTDTDTYRSFSLCGSTTTQNPVLQLINKNLVHRGSLYRLNKDRDFSDKTQISTVSGMPVTGTNSRMSVIALNGLFYYRLSYTDNTIYIDVYALNNQWKLNGGTKIQTYTVNDRGGTASSAILQYRNGFLFLSGASRGDNRYMYATIFRLVDRNDSGSIVSHVDVETSRGPANPRVSNAVVNYNYTRGVLTLASGGTGYQLYTYGITPTYCYNTKRQAVNVNLTTPVTLNRGTTYRIKLSNGSGQFQYGAIEGENTNAPVKVFENSVWNDVSNRYAYLDNDDNGTFFYTKADANTISGTYKPKINTKQCNVFERVRFDFMGISKKFSNLVPGETYYLDEENPGKVTENVGNTNIGEALSETDLLLTTS